MEKSSKTSDSDYLYSDKVVLKVTLYSCIRQYYSTERVTAQSYSELKIPEHSRQETEQSPRRHKRNSRTQSLDTQSEKAGPKIPSLNAEVEYRTRTLSQNTLPEFPNTVMGYSLRIHFQNTGTQFWNIKSQHSPWTLAQNTLPEY